MQHAYASFNKTIEAIAAEVAPGVPVIFGHPTGENGSGFGLPAECIRVYWLQEGRAGTAPNEEQAMIQLDIYKPHDIRAARALGAALNKALGFQEGAGFGILGRFDHDQSPPVYLSEMRLRPFESGWMTIPDPSPGQVHLARTFFLTYTV